MNTFQKGVIGGAAFALGGVLIILLLLYFINLKPIAQTDFASQLKTALGKGN